MKVLRVIIMPLYILIFFIRFNYQGQSYMLFDVPLWGPLINLLIVYTGMFLFIKRRLSPVNYLMAFLLIGFYIVLYAENFLFIKDTINPFDYLAGVFGLSNKWFFYGALYSILILTFGLIFIIKNTMNIYHIIRTTSLIIVQSFLAFLIPFISFVIGGRDYYYSYFWPLKMEYLYPDVIFTYALPIIMYSFIGSLIVFPLLAVIFGKRFYCSWFCGCGGLAETLGDRWRHLSDKSGGAWKFERFSIHSVLILAVFSTIMIYIEWLMKRNGVMMPAFSNFIQVLRGFYGYIIGFVFAGVLGVGFYPTLGSRVWCRFFCPMAAMLGLIQKAGRFQITVKQDMCISCGNCSTYCEMGIDVRLYAQQNQSFIRASCVGCGMCAHVCPRGVLRLENKKRK